jgi:hypothetical protein
LLRLNPAWAGRVAAAMMPLLPARMRMRRRILAVMGGSFGLGC